MPIGIIFTGIVAILRDGFMRCKLFKPDLKIIMKALFVVIDENGGRDVHGVDEHHSFGYTAFAQALFNLRGNIDKCPSRGRLKP